MLMLYWSGAAGTEICILTYLLSFKSLKPHICLTSKYVYLYYRFVIFCRDLLVIFGVDNFESMGASCAVLTYGVSPG